MGVGNDGLGRWEYLVMVSEKNGKCHKVEDPENAMNPECGYIPEKFVLDIIDTREDNDLCGLCF